MHRPQASQASAFTSNAWRHRWAKPLIFPLKLSADLNSSGKESTLKSPTGQTFTHSPLPSHRLRSITGTKVPAATGAAPASRTSALTDGLGGIGFGHLGRNELRTHVVRLPILAQERKCPYFGPAFASAASLLPRAGRPCSATGQSPACVPIKPSRLPKGSDIWQMASPLPMTSGPR